MEFKEKLKKCRVESPTLDSKIFRHSILPMTLIQCGCEMIDVDPCNPTSCDFFDVDQDIGFFLGDGIALQIEYMKPPPNVKVPRSFIDRTKIGGVVVFTIHINKYCRPDTRWICLAHEIFHFFAHRDLLKLPRGNQDVDVRSQAENEASFFSHLVFWPIEKAFSPKRKVHISTAARILFRSYQAEYNKHGFEMPDQRLAIQYCYMFLVWLKKYFPRFYRSRFIIIQ